MKLGYDRIYDTNLPFKLTNKIESINETVSIDGKKIKNCIKISGYGKTSYNPGPPLDVINIEVFFDFLVCQRLWSCKVHQGRKIRFRNNGKNLLRKKYVNK